MYLVRIMYMYCVPGTQRLRARDVRTYSYAAIALAVHIGQPVGLDSYLQVAQAATCAYGRGILVGPSPRARIRLEIGDPNRPTRVHDIHRLSSNPFLPIPINM